MSKSQVMIMLALLMLMPACATSPEADGLSSSQPGWRDCPRMEPMGSALTSKPICSRANKAQRAETRQRMESIRQRQGAIGNDM